MREIHSITEEAVYELMHYPERGFTSGLKNIAKKMTGRYVPPKDLIFWPTGMLANAMMHSHREIMASLAASSVDHVMGDDKEKDMLMDAVTQYFERWIRRGSKIYYLDDVYSGAALITLQELTGEPVYKEAAEKMYEYLLQYRRDDSGSFVYRETQDNDHVYVDGIGMVCPFLAKYAAAYKEPQAMRLAVTQIMNFLNYGMDEKTGLPYHGYDCAQGVKYGLIGWGRAVGWLLIGMVGVLEYLDESDPNYSFIKQSFRRIVDRVETYQLEGGLYTWQLGAKEGPVDTSATGMILYAIARGVEIKALIENHRSRIARGKDALLNCVKDNRVYGALAECKGFSEHPQIYGAYPWSLAPLVGLLHIPYAN